MNFILHVTLLVVVLAAFALWPYFRRQPAEAPQGALHGIPCDFEQQRVSRSNSVKVTVSVPCDERFEFTLQRERWFDQIAKALHLVREFQTDDHRFDDAVYVGADESGFDRWLAQDRDARQQFLDLLALQPNDYTRVTGITAANGLLTLSALAKPAMFDTAPDDLAREVAVSSVPTLKACLDRLETYASGQADPAAFRDPYAGAIRSLSALSVGLVFVPIMALLAFQLRAPPVEYATNAWADRSVYVVLGCVLCALTVLITMLLRGSARLHTVLGHVLFAAAIATLLAAPVFIRDINTEWDQSTPERYRAQVVGRYATHGRRSTTYYLRVSDPRSQGARRDLRVDSETYSRWQMGDLATVTERKGYLGRPWISGLERRSAWDDN